jgi:hypothetical protein
LELPLSIPPSNIWFGRSLLNRAFDGLTKWENQKFAIEQMKARRYGEGRYEFDETRKRGKVEMKGGNGDRDVHLDEIDPEDVALMKMAQIL